MRKRLSFIVLVLVVLMAMVAPVIAYYDHGGSNGSVPTYLVYYDHGGSNG